MTDDSMKGLREKLATIEHERWADWQKWCHEVLRENMPDYWTELNNVLERWDKQIATPYSALTEKEKDSDREQVDRYWPLIEEYIHKAVIEGKIEELESLLLHTIHRLSDFNGELYTRSEEWIIPEEVESRIAALKNNRGEG